MSQTSVFISYSSRDREDAFRIKEILESGGVQVWLDFFDIQVAGELSKQLGEKVRHAQVFCLLLSPNAVASPWVHKEIAAALGAARKRGRLRILPILLRPCAIPEQLSDIVGFDATAGLDQEAVKLRLLRTIGGETVEDRVLLDAANRLLVAEKEILLRAERELPLVAENIGQAAGEPMREVQLVVRPESLPEDENLILEIEFQLDRLFSGKMSFFLARYREGRTWPAEFGFDEPSSGDFFLTDQARLDAVFQWFNRAVRLAQAMDGTDLLTLPATFTLEFDGSTFKPQGEFNLAQTFEIPSLKTLEKQDSGIRFLIHDPAAKSATLIPAETDIDVELNGRAGGQDFCLFRSRRTKEDRIVSGSQFLQNIANPIRRDVILNQYVRRPPEKDRRPEVEAALKEGKFDSDDVRRLAARLRFSQARLARFRTLHRDAYELYQQAAELLEPLVMPGHPTPPDASLIFRACYELVDIWKRQENFENASQLGVALGRVSHAILTSDPSNPDYRKMFAGALLLNAELHAELGDTAEAMHEVAGHVEIFGGLYRELDSTQRRSAFLNSLVGAIRKAKAWDCETLPVVNQWKSALKAEVGEELAEKAGHVPSPNAVPIWLMPGEPRGWPTDVVDSPTLRYSVRIPKRWSHDPAVNGTGRQVEHTYRGRETTEWLNITFMDKANAESDMKLWVEKYISDTGFPILMREKPRPQLAEWAYEGTLPALAKKLRADEAHAYTGIAEYALGQATVLGRIYVVMLRRKTFAWKFALSIETACLPGTPDEKLARQDHDRAGAILGSIILKK